MSYQRLSGILILGLLASWGVLASLSGIQANNQKLFQNLKLNNLLKKTIRI